MKNAPILHRFEYALFRVFQRLLLILSHERARSLGRLIGGLCWMTLRSRRRTALENLQRAFPERSASEHRRLAHDAFRHLGAAACDMVSTARFDAVDLCERVSVDGWEYLDEALERGNGVLVMGAHLGCWEMSAIPVGLFKETPHIIGRPLDNPWLDRHLKWLRTRFGNETIPKRGAARGAIKVLQRGGIVGILIDQRVRPEQGIRVPFLGHPATTSPLLARFAMRTGAPIVPIFGHLVATGRYSIRFEPPIWPSEDETDAAELTGRCLEVVAEEIRRHPQTWMWMHRRWKS